MGCIAVTTALCPGALRGMRHGSCSCGSVRQDRQHAMELLRHWRDDGVPAQEQRDAFSLRPALVDQRATPVPRCLQTSAPPSAVGLGGAGYQTMWRGKATVYFAAPHVALAIATYRVCALVRSTHRSGVEYEDAWHDS
jgi:hypothetical protein